MQNDYIMRMIEQFVQAILSILKSRKAGDYKKAKETVKTAARSLLKLDVDILPFCDPNQLLEHFTDFSGNLETEKCIFGAELFLELSLIKEVEKDQGTARFFKMLSLYLYTTAIPSDRKFQESKYFEKVDVLIEELKDRQLFEKTAESLALYGVFKKSQ